MVLTRLPYNRGATCDARTIVTQLMDNPADRAKAS